MPLPLPFHPRKGLSLRAASKEFPVVTTSMIFGYFHMEKKRNRNKRAVQLSIYWFFTPYMLVTPLLQKKCSWTSLQQPPFSLGTEESGHHRKVAILERLKQEWMYGLSAKKSDHCREVAIVERFKQESMYGLSTQKSGHCGEVAIVERFKQESMYGLSAKKWLL